MHQSILYNISETEFLIWRCQSYNAELDSHQQIKPVIEFLGLKSKMYKNVNMYKKDLKIEKSFLKLLKYVLPKTAKQQNAFKKCIERDIDHSDYLNV